LIVDGHEALRLVGEVPKDERPEGCPASAGTILAAIRTGYRVLAAAVLVST
jgi:hypothetical protein